MKSNGKILVVDDSKVMRSIVKMLLEKGGYEVCEAENGTEALTTLLKNKDIDLVSLDVDMPVMNGFETCRHIRMNPDLPDSLKHLPILFVTSRDSLEDRRKGFDLGASDFLSKMEIESKMLETIDRILHLEENLIGLSALIVDDSLFARKIVARTLTSYGVITTEAANGQEAYNLLQEAAGCFDIIITDLDMPVMTGLELTRKIRQDLKLKDIPLLMLSATSDKVTQIELFNAGVTDYLTKPFIKEELLGRLKAHLDALTLRRKQIDLESNLKTATEKLEKLQIANAELNHIISRDLSRSSKAICTMLDTIGEREDMYGVFREDLHQIAENNTSLINFVSAKVLVGQAQPEIPLMAYDLKTAVKETMTLLENSLNDKDITVNVDITDGILVVIDDATFTNCILGNALTCCIDNSEPGGTIDIAVTTGAKYIELSVRDHGDGTMSTAMKDIFIPPRKTSDHKIGNEMPLIRKLMGTYGGRITCTSTPKTSEEHGTEFVIKLESAI